MAKGISKRVIEQVRAANDIVDVVQSYVPLKRAGSNYKALSPFQKEKTPSFNVSPSKQIFKCFSSGKGGDVFHFIQEMEGLQFYEAVRMLAERAGIEIEMENIDAKDRVDKPALFKLMEAAVGYYHTYLNKSDDAETARQYLAERGLDGDIAKSWRIGYAPDKNNAFSRWAQQKGFSEKQLEMTGMIGVDEENGPRRTYDRFRNRLMFPINDEQGRTVGFSGRILDPEAHPAKYINTSDTLLFRKSKVLFGMDRARRAVAEAGYALLCEGQIDTIRCQAAGFEQAVAPQGTSLTDEHVRLIKRYADAVYIIYDSDDAGAKASIRAAELFLEAEMNVRIVTLPKGEDPDSLLRAQGAEAFGRLLKEARSPVAFLLGSALRADGMNNDIHKTRAARAVLDLIAHARSAVQRDIMVRESAHVLGLNEAALAEDLNRRLRRQPAERADEEPAQTVARPPEEVAMIEVLIEHPDLAEEVSRYIDTVRFADPACRKIYSVLHENRPGEITDLLNELADEPDCHRLVSALQLNERLNITSDDFSPRDLAHDLIMIMRRKDMEKKRETLRRRYAETDETQKKQLHLEIRQLTLDIHAMRQGWERAAPILELTD